MGDIRCSAFVGASLDGCIARADGSIDWLEPYNGTGEDYGYGAFYATVDALVIGRNSFETVAAFGKWPYPGKRVIVLSGRGSPLPQGYEGKAERSSSPPAELVGRLADEGVRHVYVDGGRTIQGFIRAGLLGEITVSWIPILLGGGIPLFGTLERDVSLELLESRAYPNGIVQSRYRIAGR